MKVRYLFVVLLVFERLVDLIFTFLFFTSSYRHTFDSLFRVWKEESFSRLFSGATVATSRAVLMTVRFTIQQAKNVDRDEYERKRESRNE